MTCIIAATRNPGKIREIRQILKPLEIISLSDLGFNEEIPETGSSFYENALLKATGISDKFKKDYPQAYILADDSGLEIDALGGRPGIFSARYAAGNPGIISEMSGIPAVKRNARFSCVMVLLSPGGEINKSEGRCEGRIGFTIRGSNGFGYDPIFLVKRLFYRKTMAEIPDNLKNTLSHRKKALDGIKKILRKNGLI
jgi:XTP/dITP diphosphohydrolase